MSFFDEKLFDIPASHGFTTSAEKSVILKKLCQIQPESARFSTIGNSEEHRDIDAFILGKGPNHISILSGAHADEPAGSETIFHLLRFLLTKTAQNTAILQKYTFYFLPHINPDGEARNREWISQWPQVEAYLQHAQRELPGRDLEFGYPDLRMENNAVARFLKCHAPFRGHFSLHGMGFAEGCMLLIERSWIERTKKLRQDFIDITKQLGLPLHDHDRQGEKGFTHIAPGFTTTPESGAMQQFFLRQNDVETATKFRLSSMEFVRSLGGDPFCMVTELPLFIIDLTLPEHRPGWPAAYLKFRAAKAGLLQKVRAGASIAKELATFQIRHLPLPTAMFVQLKTIESALETIENSTT